MKLVIASDIHGAAEWCERLMAQVEALNPDRVVLLATSSITVRATTFPPTMRPSAS
mgnify:CR=1 FL=1